jgi:hypothetical protein
MKKLPKLWTLLLVVIILVSGFIIACKRVGIGNILTGETGVWGTSEFGEHRFSR